MFYFQCRFILFNGGSLLKRSICIDCWIYHFFLRNEFCKNVNVGALNLLTGQLSQRSIKLIVFEIIIVAVFTNNTWNLETCLKWVQKITRLSKG